MLNNSQVIHLNSCTILIFKTRMRLLYLKSSHLSITWWKSSNLIPPTQHHAKVHYLLTDLMSSAIKGFYGSPPSKRLLSNGWLAGGTIDQQGACICLGSVHGTGSSKMSLVKMESNMQPPYSQPLSSAKKEGSTCQLGKSSTPRLKN